MLGFITKRSKYRVNEKEKLIWGGVLGNTPHRFTFLRAFKDAPAEFLLDNGRYYVTSAVADFITIFNI